MELVTLGLIGSGLILAACAAAWRIKQAKKRSNLTRSRLKERCRY
ncbi:hypothetical protein [Malikia granosa]|nr:hypothetical protein [Malikia granosa]